MISHRQRQTLCWADTTEADRGGALPRAAPDRGPALL